LKFGHDSKIGHVVDDSSRKTGGNMVKSGAHNGEDVVFQSLLKYGEN